MPCKEWHGDTAVIRLYGCAYGGVSEHERTPCGLCHPCALKAAPDHNATCEACADVCEYGAAEDPVLTIDGRDYLLCAKCSVVFRPSDVRCESCPAGAPWHSWCSICVNDLEGVAYKASSFRMRLARKLDPEILGDIQKQQYHDMCEWCLHVSPTIASPSPLPPTPFPRLPLRFLYGH